MLNELYSIYKGLEAVGESPAIKHNDIQSPGMVTTFRVILGERGEVTKVDLMNKELKRNSWSLGNGNKNQFPAVKVVYPLLVKGNPEYLKWKEKVTNPDEAEYRNFIEDTSDRFAVDMSNLDSWPGYRKHILARKDQLEGIAVAEAVYQLFDRYSQAGTGVQILEQVATLLIQSASQGADKATLKSICTLLFGDELSHKGEAKDGKRVTLLLDCFPHEDIDIYASSRDQVSGLSKALIIADSKAERHSRIGECALSGTHGEVVYDIFPKEKLNVVGATSLVCKKCNNEWPYG